MNFLARLFALALAVAVPGAAFAQVFTFPPNATFQGHYVAGASALPVGTGCTIAAGSSDVAGSCTATAAAGSVAFATAFLTAPSCIVQDSSATPVVVYATTTTQITLTTITSAHVYFWHCSGKIGG